MIETGYIYGLRLQDSSEYRYVGLTTTSPEARLGRHILDASRVDYKRRPVLNWVAKYREAIVVDTLEELYNVTSFELGEAESYWISQIRGFGHRLLNLSLGGESGSYGARWTLLPEQVRGGEKHPFYGRMHTEETKKKISEAKLGSVLSPETRAKMSASRSGEKHWAYGGGKFSDEHKANISKGLKGKPVSEGTLLNLRKMAEDKRGTTLSNETKAKISQANKGRKMSQPAWNKGKPNPTAHIRWHTNKGVSKPDTCKFCKEERG